MIHLQRATRSEDGTFGILSKDGIPLCLTLEDPWLENERNISCIPAGAYEVLHHNGSKYKDVWILNNVPNRSGILIHQGNTEDDTQGCILVGFKLGYLHKPAVLESNLALNHLRENLPDEFTIRITDPC